MCRYIYWLGTWGATSCLRRLHLSRAEFCIPPASNGGGEGKAVWRVASTAPKGSKEGAEPSKKRKKEWASKTHNNTDIFIYRSPGIPVWWTLVRGNQFSSKGREGKALYTPDRMSARFCLQDSVSKILLARFCTQDSVSKIRRPGRVGFTRIYPISA